MRYRALFDLEDKVVVVVGGAGLIGQEIVRGLLEFRAAKVVIADSNKEKTKRLIVSLDSKGLDAAFQYIDITKEKSVSDLIRVVSKKYGHIDAWINSAYPKTSDWDMKFEEIRPSSWRRNIDAHLNGYFICCKKIGEYMKRRKSGSIINLASIYGIIGPDLSLYKGTAMTMPAAYSAIKGGIIGFTRFLASYYGKYNIRVNCISPGGVYNRQPDIFAKRYSQITPLGRMAKPEDIIGGVLYLCSDASAYVTGHNLVIDGGRTII